ncbi:small subunit processome component 20 homolog [Chenopodium quinoa]|uniref:small subunit processome component 20 homolog n=1 Tax=Chenopodium quinoa TaxID=63459 RepID=UPI000B78CBEA|nr:small subunit processome component 20 homolog [Chenopodium quinoa]
MASANEAQAVKSLNTTPGLRNRRFVFKSCAQQIDELEINVFRNLETVKAKPSSGSYFFLDCLIHWRELNTAEDFISLYEELMPLVQTLSLALLHKDMIIARLLSRLQMKARLSLEAIFRLIAELSRDLGEEFIPFLPRIIESYLGLLKDKADREPEIIEQMFTSLSYIMMYLQRYLTQKVVHILEVTVKLRYYPKDFVQEFMAKALSFLLRNAPTPQLKEGVSKILHEAARKPSEAKKFGASALLWHIMRGTSSNFHSRASRVLVLLTDSGFLSIGDKFNQGSDTVTEIVIASLERCMELDVSELQLIWNNLYEAVANSLSGGYSQHLSCLLSVLISIISVDHGQKVGDYKQMQKLVDLLMWKFILPFSSGETKGLVSEAADKTFQLLLCVLDGICNNNNSTGIPELALQWAPVFQLKSSSLLTLLKDLVMKDYAILAFQSNILSGCLNVLEIAKGEALHLMLAYCERFQAKTGCFNVLEGMPKELVVKSRCFFQETICYWIGVIKNMTHRDTIIDEVVDEDTLALLWGTICCIPYFLSVEGNEYLMNLVDEVDRLLITETDFVAGVPKRIWQGLIGAALQSYHGAGRLERFEQEHTSKILHLGKSYKSSQQILSAVAEYLDLKYGESLQKNKGVSIRHLKLEAADGMDALNVFSENLFHPDKELRVSTLKILCHYELLNYESQQMDAEDSEEDHVGTQCYNVFNLLLTIEQTPISVATGRKVTLLVSRIRTSLSAPGVTEAHVLPAFYGTIGLLYNQYMDLSNAALECLSAMISTYPGLLWNKFICFFEQCQTISIKAHGLDNSNMIACSDKTDLVEHFRSFCSTSSDRSGLSITPLLLQALQRIPTVTESHSRQIVPLFLKFLGYSDENPRLESFDSHACAGKDWKVVLMEWLNLFKLMKNPRSFYCSQLLKEVLVNRLLDNNDVEIQIRVLDCLLNWKDRFLLPYEKHLKNLVSSKCLREEIATWSLSEDSNLVEEEHRAQLVPLVIRLLMPKVRSLKTLASRKHASVSNRKAVLGFIAEFTVAELPLFFQLLLKSLQITDLGNEEIESCAWVSEKCNLDEFELPTLLNLFSVERILAIPLKKRFGFLHVVEEIFRIFDASRVSPFLDLLLGCVVRILDSCASSILNRSPKQPAQLDGSSDITLQESRKEAMSHTSSAVKQFKDMRSLCLKIISSILNNYEDHDFGSTFWDIFFKAVKPLVHGFKQEGSSSEKPSSLFFCFLAMSQSPRLVSLLCREKNLIPDIFSILSVPTASEAIIYSVLKFTENLLTVKDELGIDGYVIDDVFCSNLDGLVDSLHHLCHSFTEKKRKLLKHPGETLLRVLKLLSKFINDQSGARKFVDILLLLASDGIKNSDLCMEALQILRDIVSVLRSEANTKILKAVSPILISAERGVRSSICNLLGALAENDSSIRSMVNLVCELNATTSAMELDDLDFDIIINAYDRITADYFFGVSEDQAIVILSHCIYDIKSDELILRQCAYKSLLSFVEFSALIIGEEVKNQDVPARTMAIDDPYWTDNHIQHIVNKFLLKHMGDAMTKITTMQKEWIDLLHEMVLKLSGIPNLGSLKVLCSEDAEVDFFNNIVHLQKHRKARALSRFRNIVATGQLSEFMLKKVFIPLFFSMLYDLQAGKGEHIRSACLDAIASISGQLGWKSYYALLMRCFRDMEKKLDREKVLLRLVCSILDQFHFSETYSSPDLVFPRNDVTENDPEDKTNSATIPKGASYMFSATQACLTGTVLPKLQKLLVSDPQKVNVNISVAILKVLKKLPGDTLDTHLSSIIHRISNFLKNRLQSIRDEARCALVACLKELGFEYLKLVVKALSATLKRGFELHVLGYTINFILSKGLPDTVGGMLDFCLDELLRAVDNDIFSEVAEQKEVEKVAFKMKETRKQMSFDTLRLIAQNVTFKSHGLKLLSPVTAHMQKHLTPKVKLKLETMLTHIAEGFERNSSVEQIDLFIFIYGLIDDWLSEDKRRRETKLVKGLKIEKHLEASSNIVMKCYVGTEPQCSYLIAVFALRLLHNRLRNIKLHKGDDHLISLLDPFIKLLTSCLSSKYEEIVDVALKCIFPLTRLPLPSLESQADMIKVTLLGIAQSTSNVNSPVMQSCLKLLIALLQSTKITLSADQLHVLIRFPLFVDLEKNPSFVALTLLKAIVRRKLVVLEIYDLMDQVAKLMVTSQEEAFRRKCSQILLQFLLNYQLSQKRRQEHLDFLVIHLRYEHATGRSAVLDMLKTIIKRFPESVICEQSTIFFLTLVRALANDPDNQVRSLIGIVIKHLLGRINSQPLESILNMCLTWYLGEQQQLRSLSFQALGFVVEVMKRGFRKHINDVLPVMKMTVQSAIDVLNGGQLNLSDPETIPFWKDAYYSFVLLEKILTQIPELFFVGDIEDIWQAVSELLVHPHPWICNISSRLVALYFEQMVKKGGKIGTTCLTSTSRMFLIASSLCSRLKVQLPDKGVRRIVKCNLAFAICGIQSLLRQTEFQDPCTFWSSLGSRDQGCFLKACQLLDTKSGRNITEVFTCGFDDDNFDQKIDNLSSLLVSGLLNTMGKTALQTEDTQTKMILGSFRLVAEQTTQEDCLQYAYLLLFPIYKLCEGFSGKVVSDDVKQRAEKVRQKIQDKLGTQNFVQVYNQMRNDLGEKRFKRKQEEKLMAVINPVRNAKRKMGVSAKHQAHKKRKMMATKMGRWMR